MLAAGVGVIHQPSLCITMMDALMQPSKSTVFPRDICVAAVGRER